MRAAVGALRFLSDVRTIGPSPEPPAAGQDPHPGGGFGLLHRDADRSERFAESGPTVPDDLLEEPRRCDYREHATGSRERDLELLGLQHAEGVVDRSADHAVVVV